MIQSENLGSTVQTMLAPMMLLLGLLIIIPIVLLAAKWWLRRDEEKGPKESTWKDSPLNSHDDANAELLMAEARRDSPEKLDQTPVDPENPFALPRRIQALMVNYPGKWAIAGGWAVDLHLDRLTREHEDIEVAVLRKDQHRLAEHLAGWRPQLVDKLSQGKRTRWKPGEVISLPNHEIHATPPQADVGSLEFLMNESIDENWIYRRDPEVCLPLQDVFVASETGIHYLAPEIVLLFKSKGPRPQDDADLQVLVPALSDSQRQWLLTALRKADPDHPWIELVAP